MGIKNAIKAAISLHLPNGESNVFIFSTPRSGSTWVMELIMTQPKFRAVIEPFNLRMPVNRRSLGINDWQDLYSSKSQTAIKNYFQFLCNGHYKSRFKHPFKFEYYHPITHRTVFQILHACEDKINWIRDLFNGKIIFLIRHPIAVSLSRDVFPRLNAFINSDFRQHFTDKELKYAQKMIKNGTKVELGVLSWCLQNAVPLRQRTPDWIVVTYEQLVLDYYPVIRQLALQLDLPYTERMLKRINIPSGSSKKSDNKTQEVLRNKNEINTNQWLVEKWREKVNKEEEKRLMEILENFGLDIYEFGNCLPSKKLLIR